MGIRWLLTDERGTSGPYSPQGRSIFLPTSRGPSTRRKMAGAGDRILVLAFAAFVLLAIVGVAFAAGYLIGRILL